MKIELFSDAHLKAATILYPNLCKKKDWYKKKWTIEEINTCKDYETQNNNIESYKSRASYIERFFDYNDKIYDWYKKLSLQGNGLSIACGHGNREFRLIQDNSQISILATDIAPYVIDLNNLRTKEEYQIIKFKKLDVLKGLKIEKQFDFILCHALIYCLEDEEVILFIRDAVNKLDPKGRLLLSVPSILLFSTYMKHLLKTVLGISPNKAPIGFCTPYYKKIGYLRSSSQIKKLIKQAGNCLLFSHDSSNQNKTLGMYEITRI